MPKRKPDGPNAAASVNVDDIGAPSNMHGGATLDRIRVAIVDDHPILREGLIAVLSPEPSLVIVGKGQNASDAIDIAVMQLPDVMLLDVNMPGDGLVALQRISVECPAVAVIILTVKEDASTVSAALRLGARGYVLKGIDGHELFKIIQIVKSGTPYITPTLAGQMLIEMTADGAADSKDAVSAQRHLPKLTIREDQILRSLADGRSNKQIADDLGLSESTIKHYMSNLMQKLQVKNRVEAALLMQKERGT